MTNLAQQTSDAGRTCALQRSARGGFTFTEVAIAIVLLGMAMAGVYRMITVGMNTRKYVHSHYVATVIANNRIERAKNLVFGELPLLTEQGVTIDELGAPDTEGVFRRFTTITTNWDGDPRVSRITVMVQFPNPLDRNGQPGSNEVSTLITEFLTL
jgi:prepilin-type N-terminal cleavage/methylation domain-containing protein